MGALGVSRVILVALSTVQACQLPLQFLLCEACCQYSRHMLVLQQDSAASILSCGHREGLAKRVCLHYCDCCYMMQAYLLSLAASGSCHQQQLPWQQLVRAS